MKNEATFNVAFNYNAIQNEIGSHFLIAKNMFINHNNIKLCFMFMFLISLKDRRLYIGRTNNLKRRVSEHWRGEVISTKNRRPLKLIFAEAFYLVEESKRRERWLKSGAGRGELKRMINQTLVRFGYQFL